LFVAAPKLEDVVEALLLYLTVNRSGQDCIREFRVLVWRMVVESAMERGLGIPAQGAQTGEQGFAVELARRISNPAMVLAAQIAEMLVAACEGCPAPTHDTLLERALRARDRRAAFSRVENLAVRMDLAAPLLALDALERSVIQSGRKSAMSLAARIARELIRHPEMLEAEWETAERLGYSDAMVRQARRILQDFGVVRCQRGRKGAMCGPAVSPAGVIRLLAPCLMASGSTASDNAEVANFLACDAPRIAAGRAVDEGASTTKFQASFASSLELIDMIRIENLLLELAANPLLSIMTRSLGLANLLDPEAKVSFRRRADIVAINHRILRAIEARDAESAGRLARAKGKIQQFEASYRKLA
jgi:DNA-binding FadR family transcriptional regulator